MQNEEIKGDCISRHIYLWPQTNLNMFYIMITNMQVHQMAILLYREKTDKVCVFGTVGLSIKIFDQNGFCF